MTACTRILLPFSPKTKLTYFKGVSFAEENKESIIFFTEILTNSEMQYQLSSEPNTIFGYVIYNASQKYKLSKNIKNLKNFLLLDYSTDLSVDRLVINGKNVTKMQNYIIMKYNIEMFMQTETINDSSDYFSKLQKLIKNYPEANFVAYTPSVQSPTFLSSSMFIQHLLNYYNLLSWLYITGRREKRISIKIGNLILAVITDIVLGYLMLELIRTDKKILATELMNIVEKTVNHLYSLLKWLMGSPAGLKLNNAFNKMLGNYFAYHIHLWWLFLDVSGSQLHVILKIYHYLGYLGLTFQAAIISDMICIATFHSYCIYVYAARLFNIQISGLIALLRLFVGRKYNPLRNCIDSCEYTNQELFVGTVAFTILLLLLPTTTMYYIVFTLFRLLSIGVQDILAKLIYTVQTLPLYVICLWVTRSPRVAGNILVEVENNKEGNSLVLSIKLYSKSVRELVNTFKPPAEIPKNFEWANALTNICRGKQII